MRVGYLTVPPTMPGREAFRDAVQVAQLATGYAFPNALLQHALRTSRLIIDVPAMERRRDHLVGALREIGYESTMPEGTFYLMARSPIADDVAFTDILAKHRVLVLPGTDRRGSRLVPDQPDRDRRDGRARASPALPRRSPESARPGGATIDR